MWQMKYASAVPIDLGLGFDFWPCSEGNFLTVRSGFPANCLGQMWQSEMFSQELQQLLFY